MKRTEWTGVRAPWVLAVGTVAVFIAGIGCGGGGGTSTSPTPASPSGELVLATSSLDGTVSFISTRQDAVIATVPVGIGAKDVTFSADGRKAYVGNYDLNEVVVLDIAGRTVTKTIPVGTRPRWLRITPDGQFLYVSNEGSAEVSVISTTTDAVTATVPVPGAPPTIGAIAFDPKANVFYVGGAFGGSFCGDCIHVFGYPSNAHLGTISGIIGGGHGNLQVAPDGTLVVTNFCGCCGNIQWVQSNMVVGTHLFGGGGNALALDPAGDFAYADTGPCSPNGRLHGLEEFRMSDRTLTRTLHLGPRYQSGALAISPDGQFIYVATTTKTESVLKVRRSDLTVVATIGTGSDVQNLAVSP